MYTTLDQLEHAVRHKKHKQTRFVTEFKTIAIIFGIVFVGMLLFTNAHLFFGSSNNTTVTDAPYVQGSIGTVVEESQQRLAHIQGLIDTYEKDIVQPIPIAADQQTLLAQKLSTYDLSFNTLPPVNRVVVPSIGLDIPLIESIHKEMIDFIGGNFDEELRQGAVKYPTTTPPGQDGNTLVFGHTSQEWREKNPYGTVFSDLPKLEAGERVKVIWEGEEYEYEIIDTVVRWPNAVNDEYLKWHRMEGDYITLMGCYPLGTTKQRMMVIGKRVE